MIIIGVIVAIMMIATLSRKLSNIIYCKSMGIRTAAIVDSKLTFIGVIHHEIGHIIFAVLTGAKVKNIVLFKIFSKDGTLGHVDIVPRGPRVVRCIQKGMSALGPFILGIFSILFIENKISGYELKSWQFVLGIILISQIAYHMNMSKTDIKVCLPVIPIILALIALATHVYCSIPHISLMISNYAMVINKVMIVLMAIILNVVVAIILGAIALIFKR